VILTPTTVADRAGVQETLYPARRECQGQRTRSQRMVRHGSEHRGCCGQSREEVGATQYFHGERAQDLERTNLFEETNRRHAGGGPAAGAGRRRLLARDITRRSALSHPMSLCSRRVVPGDDQGADRRRECGASRSTYCGCREEGERDHGSAIPRDREWRATSRIEDPDRGPESDGSSSRVAGPRCGGAGWPSMPAGRGSWQHRVRSQRSARRPWRDRHGRTH